MDAVSEITKAWAAGFFDGEGCVIIRMQEERRGKSSKSFALRICVSNTDLAILKLLKQIYGGNILKMKKPDKREYQRCYSWQLNGRKSERFVNDILPYSKVKQPQLALYLQGLSLLVKPHELQKPLYSGQHLARRAVADAAAALKRPHLVNSGA